MAPACGAAEMDLKKGGCYSFTLMTVVTYAEQKKPNPPLG